MALSVGTRIGPYEILSPLGAGGMGEVYRAHDSKLGRDVAIKILPDAFVADPERIARFQREAKTLASLNHPHIGGIYGLEESRSVTALVMELVEGEDLSQRIARGAMPVEEALPIAKQIAEALEAAHEQGIIHRDLKPANIKVRPDSSVKVLDFGLAKAIAPVGSAPNVSQSPTITTPAMMTGVGMILGTAGYMSPEQAKGRAADRRADIWAFGCVLFEMLAGKRAFEGEDITDTIVSVVSKEPDWRALPAATPAHVRNLLRRCLQKDPQKRLPHIGIVRIEIDDPSAERTLGDGGGRSASIWRRAAPVVAAAALATALTSLGWWTARPRAAIVPPARFDFALGEGQAFTNTGRQVVAISPDGAAIAFVANSQLYLRPVAETEVRPIRGTDLGGGLLNPVFSPDGQSIAFYSQVDATLKKIPVGGGAALTICQCGEPAPYGMTWGPDGIVFGAGGQGVKRASVNGGAPEVIIHVKAGEEAHGPQLLPGGEAVLFTIATGGALDRWDKAHIVVHSLKTGERWTLIEGGSDARYLSTGHLVYAVDGVLYAVPFDAKRLQVTSGPVAVLEGVTRTPAALTGTAQFSLASNGSLVFIPGPAATSQTRQSLVTIDRAGVTEVLKAPAAAYAFPRVSPDGARLAVGIDDGKDANVWIYDMDGRAAPRRLTFDGANRFPIWSADGGRIAYQSDREHDLALFWQVADGTGSAERLTTPGPGEAHVPQSWSPDGKNLLFEAIKDSRYALWTLSLQTKTANPFGNVQSGMPIAATFSPDGRWVAYASEPPGERAAQATERATLREIIVEPYPATGAKYLVPGMGIAPMWSPTGGELWFSPNVGLEAVVKVTTRPNLSFDPPVSLPLAPLRQRGPTFEREVDLTRDGKRVIGVANLVGASQIGRAPQIRVVLNWTEELKRLVPTK